MTGKARQEPMRARGATISLGGDAKAHPDLEPLIRPLYGADHRPGGAGESVLLIQRHPANPRRGDHAAIVKSIRNNGVYSPIKVQRSTGYVLAGNHTLDAILDQGGTSAPWVWLDVDDDEARRIMLDDNHVGDLGGYDDAMLLESLRAAEAAGDLLDTSYTLDDLTLYATLADLPVDTSGQVDPDAEMAAAGIGDYENYEGLAVHTVTVGFADLDAFAEFCRRLDITRPRKRLWFPEVPDLIESDSEHVAGQDA